MNKLASQTIQVGVYQINMSTNLHTMVSMFAIWQLVLLKAHFMQACGPK